MNKQQIINNRKIQDFIVIKVINKKKTKKIQDSIYHNTMVKTVTYNGINNHLLFKAQSTMFKIERTKYTIFKYEDVEIFYNKDVFETLFNTILSYHNYGKYKYFYCDEIDRTLFDKTDRIGYDISKGYGDTIMKIVFQICLDDDDIRESHITFPSIQDIYNYMIGYYKYLDNIK